MLVYPVWFSALDRRRIDKALRKHGAPVVSISGRGVEIVSHRYPSEAAAVQSVLAVFEIVIESLLSHHTYQPAEALRVEAHRLFGDVVAWADVWRPTIASATTLDDFAGRVRAERDTQPWWLAFVDTVTLTPTSLPVARSEPPAIDDRVPLSVEEAAERLGVHKSLVYRGIKNHTIQASRIGSKIWRISQFEIARLLDTGKYPSSN